MCFVTHPGPLGPHLYAEQQQGPALTSEPGPTLPSNAGDRSNDTTLGLDIHFSFQNIPNTQSRCGRGTKPGWGHYTPKGPLVEADNLTTGLKVKREESWLVGRAAVEERGQGLWGSGPSTGTGQQGQTWVLTAAWPGPTPGAGVTRSGLNFCVCVPAALSMLEGPEA